MKKHVYNGLLNLDRFPTVDELQRMTIDELEVFIKAVKRDLEEMENRIDTCENELKKMTK